MVRVALVSLVSLLAVPAAARAALPPANPPAKSVAGVKLGWPLKGPESSVTSGSALTVKVRSSKRRAVVSLVRTDAAGKPNLLIARRALRNGSFKIAVPQAGGQRYQLRVEIAGKRYFSWVITPAGVTCSLCTNIHRSSPLPPPDPGPAPLPLTCDISLPTPDVQVRVDSQTLTLGGTLDYAIVAGSQCVTAGAGYTWQRQLADGTWEALPAPPFPSYAVLLKPRGTFAKSAVLPADAGPGTYRLVDQVSVGAVPVDLVTGAFAVAG
jgi:hypothetical protein